MISFRNGILRIEKSSELNDGRKYRFMYEICLYLGIIGYFIMNIPVVHYLGTAALIASTLIITFEKVKTFRMNKSLFCLWYLIFIILCELSALWAYSPATSAFKYAKMLVLILIIGFGMVQYSDTREDIERLLNVYLFAALAIALIQFIGTPFDRWFAGYFGRYIGKNNSNTFGYILLFASIIGFNKAYNQGKRIWYLPVVIFLFGCVLSSSRKAVTFSAFGILCILLFSFKRKNHLLHFFIAVIASLLALQIFMTNESFYDAIGVRLLNLFNFVKGNYSSSDQGSLQLRDFYIKFAKELFEEHPILGNGFVSFHSILTDQTESMGTGYAHNNYWEVLADLGIVGFIVYFWMYAYIAFKLIVRIIKRDFENIHMLAAIMLVSEIILEWGVVAIYQQHCQMIIALIYLCSCASGGRKYYYSNQENRGG